MSSSTILLVRDVRERLETRRFGRPMRGYETVESTNAHAVDWAQAGADEGSVVVANHQTSGRGRHGRGWSDAAGQNLLFSTVLRPPLPADRLGGVMLAASLAVAETAEEAVPARARIKWPNDVLLRGRKCCGLLLESTFSGGGNGPPDAAILGIGLNVNQTSFPPAVRDSAISLQLAAQRPISRAELFADLLLRLEQRYDTLLQEPDAVRTAYLERLAQLDQDVTLQIPDTDQTVRGTVRGVAPDGALRLATSTGTRTLHAGDVTSRS